MSAGGAGAGYNIPVSLANSAALNQDPFLDGATTFIFGSSDVADQSATSSAEQTPSATAQTSEGANSGQSAAIAGNGSSGGTTSSTPSGTPLSTYLLYGGIALVAYLFLTHKKL